MAAYNKYKPFSLKFIKAYIVTMRPYLLFVSGITGILGLSFALNIPSINFLLIFFASFLSYGFGQALTDCFQIDTDSLSSPYRPLTQGVVSRTHFLIISIIGLIFCITVFAYYNYLNLLLGLAAGLGLATYTYFKKRWWGGPFYNAWIVTVLFLMAYYSGRISLAEINPNLIILSIISVFFGYANFVLSGYFKDIEADKATGYNTFPVKFGRKKAAFLSDAFALVFILSSSLTVYFTYKLNYNSFPLFSILFLLIGIMLNTISQVMLHKVKTDDQAYPAIELVVHSYILILSGIAIAQKSELGLFLLLYYAAFLLVIKNRPARNQV